MSKPRRILFVVFPGVQILDVAGPLQMFAGADDERSGSYERVVAAPSAGQIASSSGFTFFADRAVDEIDARFLRGTDTMIIAGGDERIAAHLREGRITELVKRAHGRVRRIASVCTGAFFLAAAGVLDGKRAATHWKAVERLRTFRPQIEVDADSIYVRDGAIWTSAGVTAGMDLALALIEEDLGREVALEVARRHVVFRIRPGGQAQFSAELTAHGAADGALERLSRAVLAQPGADWRIENMATNAGMSARSLSRAFAKTLHTSPAAFVERVRVDAARRALVESAAPIDRIARECGFGSLRRLDRAFRRALSVSPSAFRARFRSSRQESLERRS
jgi:transcriptional regulator GlxA family with amidase domain